MVDLALVVIVVGGFEYDSEALDFVTVTLELFQAFVYGFFNCGGVVDIAENNLSITNHRCASCTRYLLIRNSLETFKSLTHSLDIAWNDTANDTVSVVLGTNLHPENFVSLGFDPTPRPLAVNSFDTVVLSQRK